ncbi:hypothetical protein OQA88_6831 [Cercophora sp. LCS_1]
MAYTVYTPGKHEAGKFPLGWIILIATLGVVLIGNMFLALLLVGFGKPKKAVIEQEMMDMKKVGKAQSDFVRQQVQGSDPIRAPPRAHVREARDVRVKVKKGSKQVTFA